MCVCEDMNGLRISEVCRPSKDLVDDHVTIKKANGVPQRALICLLLHGSKLTRPPLCVCVCACVCAFLYDNIFNNSVLTNQDSKK